MKIEATKNDFHVSVCFSDKIIKDYYEIGIIIDKINEMINCIPKDDNNTTQNVVKIKEDSQNNVNSMHDKEHAVIKSNNDIYNIRKRLPNNVIDVASLDVKQAMTENALIRCPHCGQAHAAIIKQQDSNFYFMIRDFKDNEFKVLSEFDSSNLEEINRMYCPDSKEMRPQYFKDLRNFKTELRSDIDLVVDNDTEIICPVCQKRSSFLHWKKAWEEPSNYFEYSNICDICGNEMMIDINSSNRQDDGSMICVFCDKVIKEKT